LVMYRLNMMIQSSTLFSTKFAFMIFYAFMNLQNPKIFHIFSPLRQVKQ